MRAYIIRRLLLLIPTLWIVSILVFLSVRLIPGDAVDVLVFRMATYGEPLEGFDREAITRFLGLDVPVYVQYGRWIGVLPTPHWVTGESHFRGLLQGTFGETLGGGADTIEARILARLPLTFQLGVLSIVIGLVIALPVGIYSATRQDTAVDYAGRGIAIIGLATPNFWLALMVVIYPTIWWGWSPPAEWVPFTEDPLGNLGVLIIPSLVLGTAAAAGTMRLTRTMMLGVLRQDYIRTAWSKGLKERVVVLRHATKNALIPVVTLTGGQLPLLVAGSVIMENIFNLPGLGRLFLVALTERDYTTVSAANLVFATAVMLANLIIDLMYPYLDPRVRYE